MANELKHIGVITDGNGRWATRQGKPRSEGHTAGRETFIRLCDWCQERGVKYLSFYVLSLENLKRDKAELEHIQQMARDLCTGEHLQKAVERGVRLVLCGDRALQSPEDLALYENAEKVTEHCDKLTVMFQTFYGGRDEIVKAANKCVADGVEITEETITQRLYAAHIGAPDPDMIIRTGGYSRLSGYLPWQTVYSELYITPTLFPDLSQEEFNWACKWFEGIHRTHGGDRLPQTTTENTKQEAARGKSHAAPFARKEAAIDGTAEKADEKDRF